MVYQNDGNFLIVTPSITTDVSGSDFGTSLGNFVVPFFFWLKCMKLVLDYRLALHQWEKAIGQLHVWQVQ